MIFSARIEQNRSCWWASTLFIPDMRDDVVTAAGLKRCGKMSDMKSVQVEKKMCSLKVLKRQSTSQHEEPSVSGSDGGVQQRYRDFPASVFAVAEPNPPV